jgi:two-component system response regulator YesN
LEEVAVAIELSPPYLSSLFKKEIGINFSDYLISCRIEASKVLLKNGNLPISLIAEEVGYTDPKYFSKTFYKLVGLKPTEYRKLYQ